MTLRHLGRWLPVFLLMTMAASVHAQTFTASLTLTRGATVPMRVDVPPGEGMVPALVLAPGQNYAMGQPVMEATAKALASQGVAVFRFDWAYFAATPRGKPSEDLALELEDLRAVVAFAREHPRVKGGPVLVGGKSLGSIVAWRAFSEDPALRAAVLLTPVCSRKGADGAVQPIVDETYPRVAEATRPVLFVSGKNDPLCDTQVLLHHTAANPLAQVLVVGGDHGFEDRGLAPDANEAFRTQQLRLVASELQRFVRELPAEGGPRAP